MTKVDKAWVVYFIVKLPIVLDFYLHGPVSTFLSAVTGLPIE